MFYSNQSHGSIKNPWLSPDKQARRDYLCDKLQLWGIEAWPHKDAAELGELYDLEMESMGLFVPEENSKNEPLNLRKLIFRFFSKWWPLSSRSAQQVFPDLKSLPKVLQLDSLSHDE